MTWADGRQTPDNNLMRFVSRRGFKRGDAFLDIGCGEGANLDELRGRGFHVRGIDKDQQSYSHDVIDIRDFETGVKYDLIYDVNTLCHVENPPFEKIKSWLKPTGIFFSIWPVQGSPPYVCEGKEYTRLANEDDLREWFSVFSRMGIDRCGAPDFKGYYLRSWIVEARP